MSNSKKVDPRDASREKELALRPISSEINEAYVFFSMVSAIISVFFRSTGYGKYTAWASLFLALSAIVTAKKSSTDYKQIAMTFGFAIMSIVSVYAHASLAATRLSTESVPE